MEHQHNNMMQHRNPIQSQHDMPHQPQPQQRSSPRRPNSRGRPMMHQQHHNGDHESAAADVAVADAIADAESRHPGHVMQHRTTSSSHGLSKRARSRSRGRRQGQQQQGQQQQQHGHHMRQHSEASIGSGGRRTPQAQAQESSFHESANSRFSEEDNLQMKRCSSIGNIHGNNNGGMIMSQEGKINEYGRCIRHTNIELCCKDTPNSPWRVLLQDCPLCSLDEPSGLSSLQHRPTSGGEANHNGGSSSQATATPSTKTNRTLTTEEESTSDIKSWTMSDASSTATDNESQCNDSVCTKETFLKASRPPPPPRRPPPQQHQLGNINQQQQHFQQQNQSHSQQQQQYQQQNQHYQAANNNAFDPVQSLKELGRKLVMESEAADDASIGMRSHASRSRAAGGAFPSDDMSVGMRSQASRSSRRHPPPPPPPPPPRGEFRDTDDMSRMSSLSTKEFSQIRRQQQRSRARPPPPRGTAASGAGLVMAGGQEESNDSLLGEASDIIARMENLNASEVSGLDSVVPPSRRSNRKSQQQQSQQQEQHYQQQQQQQNVFDGGEEDPIAKAAAEKRARAQRRKEKAERKAAKLLAREQLQQQQDSHQTFTLPMNDTVSNPTSSRGRQGRTDDILQAAAQIRARARRSTSRSRERVKDASIFCGEALSDNYEDEERNNDHLSLSSEKKRSILNPHGLEDQPAPLQVERRSQSRERRNRSKSGSSRRSTNKYHQDGGDYNNDQESTVAGEQGRRADSRGRNTRNGLAYIPPSQQTTAEELLSRRREMRQKIVERRQSNNNAQQQSRPNHRRGGSGGGNNEDCLSLREEVLEGWTRTVSADAGSRAGGSRADVRSSRTGRTEERGERRRGRSRSAVRDSISKMRSASLHALRGKKGDKVIGSPVDLGEMDVHEAYTVDSGKRSTASSSAFKRLMSKNGKPRSLSRSGRSRSGSDGLNDTIGGGWANAKSDSYMEYNDDVEADARSAANKSVKSSSSSKFGGMFGKKKPLKNKKTSKGSGFVRSLSRGSFRGARSEIEEINAHDHDARSSFTYNERWEQQQQDQDATSAWDEARSMRSTSSGKMRGGSSANDYSFEQGF